MLIVVRFQKQEVLLCISFGPIIAIHLFRTSINTPLGSIYVFVIMFLCRVHSHAPSVRSHKGTYVVFPGFQLMRVSEEPVCIYLLRQNPVFTSLHLRTPVHVVPPQYSPYKDAICVSMPRMILSSEQRSDTA